MSPNAGKLLFVAILAVSCLTFTRAGAQSQLAQWGPPPAPEQREHEREEWREHHQRYFGGTVIEPGPGEGREEYRRRVQAQCNVQWDQCARGCNTIGNPYQRQACVANCNSELYECRERF